MSVGAGYSSLDGREQAPAWVREYDIGPQGQTAQYGVDNQLYINGGALTTSPASAFGLPGHKQVIDMSWSPDGRYLAIVLGGDNPDEFDYGVWIYDSVAFSAYQIMKSDFDYREADHVFWSPNSQYVLIRINTEYGYVHTFLPAVYNVHNPYSQQSYSNATWALDSNSIIVSGRISNGQIAFGRVLLDAQQTFIPLNYAAPGVVFTYAAIELYSGQIGFLGSTNEHGPYSFYLMSPNALPQLSFATPIEGRIITWEWNPARTALLLVVEGANGRRLWIMETNGASRDVTPAGGITGEVRWQ